MISLQKRSEKNSYGESALYEQVLWVIIVRLSQGVRAKNEGH